jgi:hypothetical protein
VILLLLYETVVGLAMISSLEFLEPRFANRALIGISVFGYYKLSTSKISLHLEIQSRRVWRAMA